MSTSKHKDWILASIDQLRTRKARPDLNRICHMVRRRFGLSVQEATASLEKLVDERIVVKVEYKGLTSYRNAAKWKKSAMGGHVLNSNAFIQDIQKAVSEICRNNSSGERGANIRDIEKWLMTNASEDTEKLSSTHLEEALNREVENKRLKKLFFNGHYIISKKSEEPASKTKTGATSVKTENTAENETEKKRGRPPSKRMKFKKTHGPDFEMVDPFSVGRRTKTSDRGSNDGDAVCSYCKLDSSKNTKGKHEKLLVCQDCKATAHPSCMKYSPKLAKKAYKGVWQCIDCKSCCVCECGEDATTMLFCDACDRGYHMECHQPVLKDKPRGKWVCSDCDSSLYQTQEMEWSSESESIHHEYGSFPPTPCDSPIQDEDQKFRYHRLYSHPHPSKDSIARVLSKEPKLDGDYYPDASEWSIDEVIQFFTSLGFTDNQIEVFREQEVDGKSILLMKRCDVVSGLSLKLGPALKLFQHIEGLQRAGLED